ncbi:MAG: cation:proton antiporter [Chloroflexi bacterium]|nr:cation:proton antiporter [Chloroflexota bacterium]
MPDEQELIFDLIIIIAAATGGGVLASLLRLPVILGYLVAGLVVGNYIPGWDINVTRIEGIAELGVALLLFTLGVQFSFAKMADVRRVAIVGGLVQIVLTIGLGLAVGKLLGLDIRAAVLLGAAMALSSTMVALKLLDARGELGALHGRVAVGILLVQDLAVVPMVILIPATAGEVGASLAGELALAAGKAVLLLGAAYLLSVYIVPRLLFRVAATGSRELFLLAVLSLALGLAGGSFALGLSLAFGAFLAGLVVSESEFSYQTLAEVLPLREVFATIFFVAMGMLIEPQVLLDDPGRVAAIAAALVLGKLVLTAGPVALLGYPVRTAVLSGLVLAQAGEFSFVLARVGVDEGLISADLNAAILMAAMVSMLVSPLLLQAGGPLLTWAERRSVFRRLMAKPALAAPGDAPAQLRRHVVVCGYGRMGRELVREITQRNFRCVVVEHNPYLVSELHRQGIPHVYGDATNLAVLGACALEEARVLAVTLPDPAAAELIVSHAMRLNPRLDVIVRGRAQEDYRALLGAGAAEVVQPEFEAGLEFVRHTLHRYGVDRTQIQLVLARRRRDFYRKS